MTSPKILITICARGGSKGIPKKNIKPLNGRPLIGYSTETARKFAAEHNADITLSTDDANIKKAAEQFNLSVDYERPSKLATDAAGKIEVIRDVLFYEENARNKKYDYVLDLDVTSPLRTIEDLNHAFEIIKADENALNLFSVSPANRNPYFNVVEEKENGYFALVKKIEADYSSRQIAPKVYDLNASFYFYRRNYFDVEDQPTITDKSLIYVVPHVCFDLDEPLDFEFMEFLLANDKLNFKLA